jgi:hypothetical protein
MDDRILQIQKLLDAADGNLSSARTIMRELTADGSIPLNLDKKLENLSTSEEGTVIEGVFDGEQMLGQDGKTYPVPPNYASKSKLVEGDTLKLTIANDGSFLFKQIAPTERRSAIGTLAQGDGNYTISAEGKNYKVLTASVTFYKAEPGDQVTILLPKEHDAVWAVLENVINKNSESPTPAVDETPVVTESIVEAPVIETAVEMPVTEQVENTPEIEFPAGAPSISDEQLLENLKNNLKNLEQPSYNPPESGQPKPVDNIVANDLAQLNKTNETKTEPVDKPIAELDI